MQRISPNQQESLRKLQDPAAATDIIDALTTALGVSGALLSLHFDDGDAPLVLNRVGSAADDPRIADGALGHADRLHRSGPAKGEMEIERGWLGSFGTDGNVLTIPFRSKRGRSQVVFSGLFASGTMPETKLMFGALRRLAPMLDAYFRLWQQHRREARQNRSLTSALNAMDLGIALLDRAGEVVFTNTVAATILADGRFLRRRGRMISTPRLSDTMGLQNAIALAIVANAEPSAGRQGEDAALLRIAAGDEHVIVAALSADQPATESDAVAAMLVMLHPGSQPEKLVAPVCTVYGLSKVETRLACQIIAGHPLADACRALKIKEQTGRTYLKQIFLKTNVNRQADLVRLLLSSLVQARTSVRLQRV